jgi:hypothetical protein
VRAEIGSLYSDWRVGTNGCTVDDSEPIGVWVYRWWPTPAPHAYFAFNDWDQKWEVAWGYTGMFYYNSAISGTDSFGREFYNESGYRYTKGRTLVENFEDDWGDWYMYKICKTPIGVECTGSGD